MWGYTGVMRKDVMIMLWGAFVAFLPFLGFPNSWDAVLMVIAGVCVISLGIAVRRGNRPLMRSTLARAEQTPASSLNHEA